MTGQSSERYVIRFHRFRAPSGYIHLHEALNRVGCDMDPDWGLGAIWKKHPFFYDSIQKRFMRRRLIRGKWHWLQVKLEPGSGSQTAAHAAARSYVRAISRLVKALETHAVTGYLLGVDHEPTAIKRNSVQWTAQGKQIFTKGKMRWKADNGKFRSDFVIVKESQLDGWLGPKESRRKSQDLDDAAIKRVVRILENCSAQHGNFRYSFDSLYGLLKHALAGLATRRAFQMRVYDELQPDHKKLPGRGAPNSTDVTFFESVSPALLEDIKAELEKFKNSSTI